LQALGRRGLTPTSSLAGFVPGGNSDIQGWNVYFHVNTVRPGLVGKAKREDIVQINAAYDDLDWGWSANPGRYQERIEELTDQQQALYESSTPPNISVFTGGGYQNYYILKQPIPNTPNNSARIEAISRAIADQRGGDQVSNIDRILRLPGLVNYPNPRKVAAGQPKVVSRVAACTNRKYSLQELEEHFNISNRDTASQGSRAKLVSGWELPPRPPNPALCAELSAGIEHPPLDVKALRSAAASMPRSGSYVSVIDGVRQRKSYDLSRRHDWLIHAVFPAVHAIHEHPEYEAEIIEIYHVVCRAGVEGPYEAGSAIWEENEKKVYDELARLKSGILPEHHVTTSRWFSMAREAGWDQSEPGDASRAPNTDAIDQQSQAPEEHEHEPNSQGRDQRATSFGSFGNFGSNAWPAPDMSLLGTGQPPAAPFPTHHLGSGLID
jgi:hypothetical protein